MGLELLLFAFSAGAFLGYVYKVEKAAYVEAKYGEYPGLSMKLDNY